jgi:hypothetical protein
MSSLICREGEAIGDSPVFVFKKEQMEDFALLTLITVDKQSN